MNVIAIAIVTVVVVLSHRRLDAYCSRNISLPMYAKSTGIPVREAAIAEVPSYVQLVNSQIL